MWNCEHYVPVLRWKQAEWSALRNLKQTYRGRVTPLVEITPGSVEPRKRRPSLELMLSKNLEELASSWVGMPVFVDLVHLPSLLRMSDGRQPILFIGGKARGRGVQLIPVTGPYRSQDFQNAVRELLKADRRGVCVRLFRADLRQTTGEDLRRLLKFLEIDASQADLILDYQVTPDKLANLDYPAVVGALPELARWRTVTLISGAFPANLTAFTVGEHELPRRDWNGWLAIQNGTRAGRRPAFGDYTIQHGIYAEPPERANFSASIRYTSQDYWVIMRGEGVFNDDGPGFAQWPANAQLLCDRQEFCGAPFSEGDKYIYEMSQQSARTGNAGTWLQAGINHHLTYVARQVASLGATS